MAYSSLIIEKGVSLSDTTQFDHRLVRHSLCVEDRNELVQDIISSMHRTLAQYLPNTSLQYRYGFKLLPNGDLLLGLDPRELIPFDEADEEISHDHEDSCTW